jgi:phosphoserine aminotransferase
MFENFNVPEELIPADPRFGSGPSLVPTSYLESLAATGTSLMGTSHRKAPIKNLVKTIQDGLREYFNLPEDYTVAVGNGGATFLFDMIGLGMVKKKSVHYTCGEFSSKWFKSHNNIPWIDAQEISVPFGSGNQWQADHGDADMVCVTLNETSTGVMTDGLPTVGDDVLLAVDATSGGGQCPCDVSQTDVFYFSPQKVFASDGGFFVAILSPKARARAMELDGTDRYIPGIMNWNTCLTNSDKNQTYNTPAIATLYFLAEQVKAMNTLGYNKVLELAKKKAELLYGWAESKPYLSCYVEEAKFRSTAVATINVDDSLPVDGLIKRLAELNVAYGIEAYRKLGKNQFRIALFHNVAIEDLEKLTKIISLALES